MKASEQYNKYINEFNKMFHDIKNNDIAKHIPNLLTLSRGVTPIFTIPLTLCGKVIPATIISSATACTDLFDGYIARKYNLSSEFGKDLDAICDKIYAGGLIIPLVIKDSKYFALVSLESIISLITVYSKLNEKDPSSSMIGKIKSTSLFTTLVSSYFSLIKTNNTSNKNIDSLIKCTLSLQILTIIDYYLKSNKKQKMLTK